MATVFVCDRCGEMNRARTYAEYAVAVERADGNRQSYGLCKACGEAVRKACQSLPLTTKGAA
jgi:hypothetical protein